MNICVYGASSKTIDKDYIAAGEKLGKIMAERGHTLVFGGGGSGLMGAAARGVKGAGGRVVGVAPSFFNVDGILYEHCDDFIYTETMRERKQIMENMSDGFVMTPGGIGTFEEFFEILTLRQLGKHQKPIAVLNTNGYFSSLVGMIEDAIAGGFMTEKNRSLFGVFESPEEAVLYIEEHKGETGALGEYKNV